MLSRRRFIHGLGLFCFGTANMRMAMATEKSGGIKQIHADMMHKNCSAEFYVNGIPIRKYDPREQLFTSVPAHRYLVDGVNHLELVVNPGPTPSKARDGQQEMDATGIECRARIVRGEEGAFTGDPSEVLAQVEYRGEAGKKDVFPKVLSTRVELGPLFGRWLWQDAETLTLDAKTVDAVMQYVRIIHGAYGRGDGALIANKAKIVFDEGQRANKYKDMAFSRQRFIDSLKTHSQLKGWKMVPLEQLIPDLRVVANGKMIEAVARDWKPLVRTQPVPEYNNDVWDYRMFLSRIGGEWVMVR